MRVGIVSQLWRYPVKSMGGERLERARLSWRGIPGDRGWAVFDETRGGISNGKRLPALRGCTARYSAEPEPGEASPSVEVTFPDGRTSSESAALTERLAALVGRAVSLRGLGAGGSDAAPRVTLEGDPPETLRLLNGLLPDEPLPDMSAFPPERLLQLRQGNYFDALPVHVLTRTTLTTLAAIAPESDWDERRFRPNVFVEADDARGYPELDWIGRRLRVGSALIEVVTGCPRCVMVTQPVDGLPPDPRIMRTLVRETRHTAGIYARVVEEGDVLVGDAVEIL